MCRKCLVDVIANEVLPAITFKGQKRVYVLKRNQLYFYPKLLSVKIHMLFPIKTMKIGELYSAKTCQSTLFWGIVLSKSLSY